MKAKPLLFNGKPYDPHPPRPLFVRLAEWLDRRPGEVFTPRELKRESGHSKDCIGDFSLSSRYKDYVYRSGHLVALGAPSAIQEFRKMTETAEGHED